jgi:hypothetical protein
MGRTPWGAADENSYFACGPDDAIGKRISVSLPRSSAVNYSLPIGQHGAEFGAGFSPPLNLHPGAERERTASMLMASEFVVFVSIG